MKSELIFRKESSSRGRYGDINKRNLSIGAYFDDPAKWPYILNVQITTKSFRSDDTYTDNESYKLSKELYLSIKSVIKDAQFKLAACSERIENDTMDGAIEYFTFSVDGFEKHISGDEIFSSGAYEAEKATTFGRSENYVIYTVISKIKALLEAADIYVL